MTENEYIENLLESDLPSSAKLIVFVLLKYRNRKTGLCYPSISTIASDSSLSQTCVKNNIKILKSDGFIEIEKIKPKHTKFKVNSYIIHIDKTPSQLSDQVNDLRSDQTNDQVTDQTTDQTVSDHKPNKPYKPNKPIKKNIKKKVRRNHDLPKDWQPNFKHMQKCSDIGADTDRLAEEFKDYHLARGNQFKDWDRAFNTWIRNSEKYSKASEQRATAGQQEPAGIVEAAFWVAEN